MKKTFTFRNGSDLLRLGQGTWKMGENPSLRYDEIKALQSGIDLGMNIIDTAEMYGNGKSEILVGEAVKGRRDNVFLISKVLPSNATYRGTKTACENSLKRLKTDFLDLYLLHWQGPYPFVETINAFMELANEGKIRQWGASNMDVAKMKEIYSLPQGDLCATDQVLYNLSRRGIEYDLLPWCEENKIPVIAYSPIEQGRILTNSTLVQIAAKHSATPSQVALAWVMRDKNIIPIPKAGTKEHVESNFKSLGIELDEKDLDMIDNTFPAPSQKTGLEMI